MVTPHYGGRGRDAGCSSRPHRGCCIAWPDQRAGSKKVAKEGRYGWAQQWVVGDHMTRFPLRIRPSGRRWTGAACLGLVGIVVIGLVLRGATMAQAAESVSVSVGSGPTHDVPMMIGGSPVEDVQALPMSGRFYQQVCGPVMAGLARCLADVVTGGSTAGPLISGSPQGYGPADLQDAYKLSGAAASFGATQTVAIVDAYDDPTAESDLATYRAQYGLSACSSANGCFRKVDQRGGTNYPPPDSDWDGEIALDTDMVSAICPNCHILLVEADDSSLGNLGVAVDEAVALGATQISNSYAAGEFLDETSYDAYYDHPGIAVTASSGDSGFGVEYPAASPYVTAVGGTSLTADPGTPRGWTESAWSGAGSGCSEYEAKPSWQTDTGCPDRSVADVSAVADPGTAVAVYSSAYGGWTEFGGTSVASPIVAAYDALIGPAAASPNYPYANPGSYFDVTSGSNGACGSYLCDAGPGYDGPTGVGTPNGANLMSTCAAAPTITTNPGNQIVTAPATATFSVAASNSDLNCHSLTVQWQVSTNGGSTFTNITGATSGALSISPTSHPESGSLYQAVFTNEFGSTTTTAGTLTVKTAASAVGGGGSAKVKVGHVTVAGMSASVPLSCSGTAGELCKMTLSLTVTETVKGAKLIAVSAAKSPKLTKKVLLLGKATVTVRAGQAKTIKVTLGAAGKRLLARQHHMEVKLTVTQLGRAEFTTALSFKTTR